MNENNESSTNWTFRSPEEKQHETETSSGFGETVLDTVSRIRSLILLEKGFFTGIALLGVAVLLLFLLQRDTTKNTKPEIPGGKIEALSSRQMTDWINVLSALSDRDPRENDPVRMHSSNMISFYSELEMNTGIKKLLKKYCKQEGIKFQKFQEITFEIGLALQTIQSKKNSQTDEDSPPSNTETESDSPDTNLEPKNLTHNQQLILKQQQELEQTWQDFLSRYYSEASS